MAFGAIWPFGRLVELDKHTSAPKRKAESAALQASEPNVPDALSYLYERTQCTGAASKGVLWRAVERRSATANR